MRALLVVNPQKDFLPGGSVGVREASKVFANINKVILDFDIVVAVKSWYPENAPLFENLPSHCVQSTDGAAFYDELITRKFKTVFEKGNLPNEPGLSAFSDPEKKLDSYFKDLNISELYIVGFSAENDILKTALDASEMGYKTFVFKDAIGSIELLPGDRESAFDTLTANGVLLISTKTILA